MQPAEASIFRITEKCGLKPGDDLLSRICRLWKVHFRHQQHRVHGYDLISSGGLWVSIFCWAFCYRHLPISSFNWGFRVA